VTARALDVLIALPDEGTANAAAAALRRRGHRVFVAIAPDGSLAAAGDDVLVCDLAGLELLRARGQSAPAVLVDLEATPESFRRAVRLGARDVLTRPFLLSDLVASVESSPAALMSAAPNRDLLRCTFEAEPDSIEGSLRELAAFLVGRAVCPSTRTRALSACAEVLDNVVHHAFAKAGSGRGTLEAELDTRELKVTIHDAGVGFDATTLTLDGRTVPARNSGLGRAAALCEDLRVESAASRGTRVSLTFTAYRVEFDEDDTIDLSELDWLSPGLARRVLASIMGDSQEPLYNLSPALAVTVGRLLTGAAPRQLVEKALRN
jgi:anti-sigma regulatory factor (Ser/Thr protein kinase)